MRNSIKKLTLGLVALGALSLSACMSSGSSVGPGNNNEFGTIVVQTNAKNLNSLSKPGLGKSALIQLDTLIVTAISNASTPDTVIIKIVANDTTIIGTDSVYNFKDSSSINQTISFQLNLKALRTWYISALTKDVNDSTIHTSETDTVASLLAGQVRIVSLTASPLYAMYKATFNFPDSISSPTGLFAQNVSFSKIEMLIDGDLIVDSSASFPASTNILLTYDYVSVDADSVTLKVYGTLPDADAPWDTEGVLYEKTVAISSLNTTSLNTIPLSWKGPVDGAADLTISIGKVGTYDIEAGINPTILD